MAATILSLIFVLLASFSTPIKAYKPCNTLPLSQVNFQDMITYSPFTFFLTNIGVYNCSTVQFTNPAPGFSNYSGTATVVQGSNTFSFDLTLNLKGTVYTAFDCSTGMQITYNVVYNKIVSSEQAAQCVAVCNGTDYQYVACSGRSQSDFNDLQQFLNDNLEGVAVTRAQANCPSPKHCPIYVN